MDRSLRETAALLDIAPATLRKWSAQFAVVLSDSTRQSLTAHGGAPQRHYTEADIAVLRQAKTLLRSGYTYDQVRDELSGESIADPPADRAEMSDPASALPGDTPDPPTTPPTSDEQIFDDQDETIAELERTIQAQQIQIDQLYADVLGLQLENQALRRQARPRRTEPARLPYRLGIILTLCSLLVLAGISLMLVVKPDAFRGIGGVYVAPPATSTQAPDGVEQQWPLLRPSIVPSTPAVLEPASAAAKPMPTASPAAATTLLQQVSAAEAMLQTGEISATIDYGDGSRASARIRFDLGDGQRAPHLHMTSTYTGGSGAQTVERITIGGRSWQRQPDGVWVERQANESVADQVQVFLPHARSITDPTTEMGADHSVLRWYDADYDANITLTVDHTTGIPRELRRVARAADTILTVTYSGWNTPVEIAPPDEA
jgi:DNA-binding transcriptional MerR regulator